MLLRVMVAGFDENLFCTVSGGWNVSRVFQDLLLDINNHYDTVAIMEM